MADTREPFDSRGFTGRTAGWAIAEYTEDPKGWRWWARFDAEIAEGVEPSYEEATAAVKRAVANMDLGTGSGGLFP